MALGSYPDVGPKAARQARDDAKAEKSEGRDPVQARKIEMTLPLDCVSHNRAHELACLASHSLSNCIGLT